MGRFLTWVLLALVALGVLFYFYQRNIQPVPVAATDLDTGGSFSDGERAAMIAACSAQIKKDGDKACACIADKAASQISRFDRLVLTATFQDKLSDIVALTKGLVQSGIPAEKVQAAEKGSKERLKSLMAACTAG